jgi:hypothetical protein
LNDELKKTARIFAGVGFLIALFLFATSADALAIEQNATQDACFCVKWIRTHMGVFIQGDAWKQVPNSSVFGAERNDVLLFDYGGTGKDHAALITGFLGEYFTIIEANYKRCQVTERLVHYQDPTIKGVLRTTTAY